ncbi:hypothetical protein E1264_03550 [Actinomadura sp. KC216]|uniref:hypothetical protein n=1 Tax=Actinomadura sp. KC216 TaxID=2530370 RepID=UPI001053268B|nr:hypothetical protein [Actinomadura sp. KC216]TDB90913.1 hypothetical protein E1264_03550 [Actinomadura sp. KC216]
MALLDRATEDIVIWPLVLLDDGYRGQKPGKAARLPNGAYEPPEGAPVTVKGIPIPASFSGAGWALNQRYQEQGFAEVARMFLYVKYDPSLRFDRWTRVEVRGREWTVVDQPELWIWKRNQFWKATIELRGDV